jgi:hypothetical protein
MTKIQNNKQVYNLEEKTFQFFKDASYFLKYWKNQNSLGH